jgi:hypothetical protein
MARRWNERRLSRNRSSRTPRKYRILRRLPRGGESLNTFLLTEGAGKTTLTEVVRYPSQQIPDAVVKSGMEHVAATYDRLAELLEMP